MHRTLIPASVLVLFAAAFTCAAQSSDSRSQSQSAPAKPVQQTSASEASQAPPPATKTAAPKDQPRDKDKKKPKKVWTNEEMSSVGGTVSVVGDPNSSNNSYQSPGSSSAPGAHDVSWYRNKLAPLRTQVSDLDHEIQQLKNSKGSVRENVESQVQIRETKRNKIQRQIDDLEEDARRQGIAAGDLR